MAEIQKAMNAVMRSVGSVRKGERNQAQGFNFRGIDAVVNAVGPALREHQLTVHPVVQSWSYQERTVGKNGSQVGHVVVHVNYVFTAVDGSTHTTSVVGEAMDSGDKAVAKAMSVAFRIALLQALCLPTDEPDPDSQSYERTAAVALDAKDALALVKAAGDLESVRKVWNDYESVLDVRAGKSTLRAEILARVAALQPEGETK